jgi:hypothetical protein
MLRWCCEFVDSRLRRSPPDRASAVPYGQAGENAMRFPRLAHRSAAAHKLHSTPQQHRMNLISGNGETSSRRRPLAYSSPEAVQTTGTVARCRTMLHRFRYCLLLGAAEGRGRPYSDRSANPASGGGADDASAQRRAARIRRERCPPYCRYRLVASGHR